MTGNAWLLRVAAIIIVIRLRVKTVIPVPRTVHVIPVRHVIWAGVAHLTALQRHVVMTIAVGPAVPVLRGRYAKNFSASAVPPVLMGHAIPIRVKTVQPVLQTVHVPIQRPVWMASA